MDRGLLAAGGDARSTMTREGSENFGSWMTHYEYAYSRVCIVVLLSEYAHYELVL